MPMTRSKSPVSALIIAITALLITATCQAQYVWLDEKGNKQFSDMPPPVSVPAQKILKAPQKNNGSSTSATKTPTEQTKNEASNINEQLKKPATTASKNEEFNKRKIEQEEKDKKKAAEDQLSADKAQNCERARAYQKTIESGQRITTTSPNGERAFISDAQRAQELAEVQRVLKDCK
jgi:hypothetical protein